MLTKLVYPSEKICYLCTEVSNVIEGYLCPECRVRLIRVDDCRTINSPYIEKVYSSLLYTSFTKELLHKFKFEDGGYLYKPLANIMTDTIKNLQLPLFDIIIPVPIHRRKEAIRGYNQSNLLAREIGKLIQVKAKSNLIVKFKNTLSQSQLQYHNRQTNLDDAFRVKQRGEIIGKDILLIDDIITTGSTMKEVSKTLVEAGAKSVVGLTLTTTNTFAYKKTMPMD